MKHQKTWYWVGGVVVVAVVLWWIAGASTPSPYGPGPSSSGTASTTGGTNPKTTTTPKTSIVAMPKTYSDAIAQYAGKRIQFDQYCQAIPTSLNFKNGVSLMLDNRSGDARTIKIDGLGSYALSGYGWKIVTLTEPVSKLPARLDIDCGSAQNVSYIVLEK